MTGALDFEAAVRASMSNFSFGKIRLVCGTSARASQVRIISKGSNCMVGIVLLTPKTS